MRELLVSGAVFGSFLGGMVALLAPCCISVMLPAYFAATFRRRSRIVAMTLVFALGIATVILPIALGASAVSRLLVEQHTWIFATGGVLMMAGGAAILAGWKPRLPMPSFGGHGGGSGVGSVYALGAFSGTASACCAPVLAGVVAVSGAVSSFPTALAVGVAYVFGMVAPLSVLALVWDRRDWRSARIFTQRTIRLPIGRPRREIPVAWALSGALLVGMGALALVLAVTGPAMPNEGWRVRVAAWLDHTANGIEAAMNWLPGWLTAGAVFAALATLVWFALRHHRAHHDEDDPPRSLVSESAPAVPESNASAAPRPARNHDETAEKT